MNTFGRIFRVTTYGESHGCGIGCIVDGCPSGLGLTLDEIQTELDRRKPGNSPVSTQRKESDLVEILSGIFEGKTLGTPISMMIRNIDADSTKYSEIADTPRPGHADLAWKDKFSYVDFRGGGRASGRETASRVAAGAVAKKLLKESGVEVIAYTTEIAGIKAGIKAGDYGISDVEGLRQLVYKSVVKTPDKKQEKDMLTTILTAKKEKDSVGGIIEAIAFGVPPGLGEPVFDKLDADLAKALMSIPSIKGVEIGSGFEAAGKRGSEANDSFMIDDGQIRSRTNHAGGILGGISTGMPIVVRVAVKPTSSIGKKQQTVNLKEMKETTIEIKGRHDPCIVPRAVPVVEAMMALVLADHGLRTGFIPRRLL